MALLPGEIEGRDTQKRSDHIEYGQAEPRAFPMPRLSQDASTILRHMKTLHADTGDYVLVDAFMSLLDDNEHRGGRPWMN
jgi:hypothetical protein